MFRNRAFQRVVSSYLLIAFSNLLAGPVLAATRALGERQRLRASAQAAPASAEEQFAQLLAEMRDELKENLPGSQASAKRGAGVADMGKLKSSIRGKGAAMRRLYAQVEDGFSQTERHLHDTRHGRASVPAPWPRPAP